MFLWSSRETQQKNSWNLLKNLSIQSNLPWCCIGDFNDLLAQSEKKGRLRHSIQGFRDTVEYYGLQDLGMVGYPYTWEKSRGSINFVEEQLDRVLASQLWLSKFDNALVRNIEAPSSDHSALLLDFLSERRLQRRRFRFENSWLKELECRTLVTESWGMSTNSSIQTRLELCGNDLSLWGDKLRAQFKDRILECRRRIRSLKAKTDDISLRRYKEASEELGNLLQQQESYWKQRAKQFWLESGDSNTKFFHQFASPRRKKNTIVKLRNEDNHWFTWDNGLSNYIVAYFADLFTSRGCDGGDIFRCVKQKVTTLQNQELIRPFKGHEIKDAIFSMHLDKSPGPDGMNPGFFQHF